MFAMATFIMPIMWILAEVRGPAFPLGASIALLIPPSAFAADNATYWAHIAHLILSGAQIRATNKQSYHFKYVTQPPKGVKGRVFYVYASGSVRKLFGCMREKKAFFLDFIRQSLLRYQRCLTPSCYVVSR